MTIVETNRPAAMLHAIPVVPISLLLSLSSSSLVVLATSATDSIVSGVLTGVVQAGAVWVDVMLDICRGRESAGGRGGGGRGAGAILNCCLPWSFDR